MRRVALSLALVTLMSTSAGVVASFHRQATAGMTIVVGPFTDDAAPSAEPAAPVVDQAPEPTKKPHMTPRPDVGVPDVSMAPEPHADPSPPDPTAEPKPDPTPDASTAPKAVVVPEPAGPRGPKAGARPGA